MLKASAVSSSQVTREVKEKTAKPGRSKSDGKAKIQTCTKLKAEELIRSMIRMTGEKIL